MELLLGSVHLLKSTCWFGFACGWPAGCCELLLFIWRGVLQGCPLSGVLFAWALDPYLRMMTSAPDDLKLGTTRACADDVGAAVKHFDVLPKFCGVFFCIERTTALCLDMKKRVPAPLARIFCLHPVSLYRGWWCWMQSHLPE